VRTLALSDLHKLHVPWTFARYLAQAMASDRDAAFECNLDSRAASTRSCHLWNAFFWCGLSAGATPWHDDLQVPRFTSSTDAVLVRSLSYTSSTSENAPTTCIFVRPECAGSSIAPV
jgi:hypothetical protein